MTLVAIVCLGALGACGQDTLTLPTQTIVGERSACAKIETLKAPHISGSLADAVETPFVFRRYSPGGLASVSLRGTGPTHTQLYWNGLAVHSPLLGQSDFNLFFKGGRLLYGGASLEYGIGGFGGAIVWQSSVPIQNEFRTSVSWGSFGTRALQNTFAQKFRRWAIRLNTDYRQADNDFSFKNMSIPGQPTVTQRSAKALFVSLNPEVVFR
ncbi:MAG: TonB-dependent receptor, partial [Bacteroidia bacterium]|nr:TonB-dependent receptor [Bacteroidia bacterium]